LAFPDRLFYRWYDRNQRGGPEATADRPLTARSVWNRIPEGIRSQIVDLARDQPELSPRELAVRFTDEQEYFVSKTSVYRLLKRTILSPAYIVIQAAEAFKDKTTRPTSSGRPTSPISRSRAEAGTISPPCSTISRASLLPGSSVRL
jgi:putative transposase